MHSLYLFIYLRFGSHTKCYDLGSPLAVHSGITPGSVHSGVAGIKPRTATSKARADPHCTMSLGRSCALWPSQVPLRIALASVLNSAPWAKPEVQSQGGWGYPLQAEEAGNQPHSAGRGNPSALGSGTLSCADWNHPILLAPRMGLSPAPAAGIHRASCMARTLSPTCLLGARPRA